MCTTSNWSLIFVGFIIVLLPCRTLLCFPIISSSISNIARSSSIQGLIPRKTLLEQTSTFVSTENETSVAPAAAPEDKEEQLFCEIGATFNYPYPRPLTPSLKKALEIRAHPIDESQDSLGSGTFITRDWRRAWYTFESPPDNPNLIDAKTGFAEYEIDNIDGCVPSDLVGVLYRNGPGKFGVNGERVQHVLDADGLIIQVTFPHQEEQSNEKRKFTFRSRFVMTHALLQEEEAGEFLYRGTFGTAPRGLQTIFGKPPQKGLNQDPSNIPILSKVAANAFNTNIKNPANTQVISFGGKVLALFEAGLPHRIDPITLETIGEDDMQGTLAQGKMPVKISSETNIPSEFLPSFISGAAHTAHPNICPRSGNLVGWHWSMIVDRQALEVTFTEWSPDDFTPISSSTFLLPNCDLAPHDMALTDNCIILAQNALKMNQVDFLSGLKGPAASLKMDGRANTYVHVFPRPTSKEQFQHFVVEVPASFSIHFSHAYEDPETGYIVTMFSGWPPSDSKDFLGAWGGFAPNFAVIPPTYLFKLVIDPQTKACISLNVAPGSVNVCAEHPVVHPNFTTRKARNVYAVASNVIGDSSPPCGYVRLRVEDGETQDLPAGRKNSDVDAYWFGGRYFAGEPLIVPKQNGNPNDENAAYLLGMVQDSVQHRSAVAIFDLQQNLKEGPVAMLWLKHSVPHGLHGCFATEAGGSSSVFC
jgi:all-trans-8'-apo-beta-carotenal 15,15'-oxygenase